MRNEQRETSRMRAAFATADNCHVELHAWMEDGGSLRDCNHALAIADALAKTGNVVREAPGVGKRMLFEVWITVEDTRGGDSVYTCDYHRHNGCPLNVIDAGMELYHEFKRVMRSAMVDERKRKESAT